MYASSCKRGITLNVVFSVRVLGGLLLGKVSADEWAPWEGLLFLVTDRKAETEVLWQLVLRVQTVGEVDATHAAVGVYLQSRNSNVNLTSHSIDVKTFFNALTDHT